MPPVAPERADQDGSGPYLRAKEIDFLPSGALRWWLLGLIVLGWAVEQYEGLKTGPVLVYVPEGVRQIADRVGLRRCVRRLRLQRRRGIARRARPIASDAGRS